MFERPRAANSLERSVIVGLGTLAPLLLIILIAGVWQFWRLQGTLNRQADFVTLLLTEHDTLLQMVNEETGVRGYLASGDPRFLQTYDYSIPLVDADLRVIQQSSALSPSVRSDGLKLGQRVDSLQRYFVAQTSLARAGNLSQARANLGHGRELFDAFRVDVAHAEEHVNGQLAKQRQQTRIVADAAFAVGIFLCAVLALSSAAFFVLLRRARSYRLTSMRDQLTGAANRSGVIAAIDGLINTAASAPFGLVFIDLDGFKKINDVHGHAAGDEILRGVAARLERDLRNTDVVGRLGGDEFVCVISPVTTIDEMRPIASRLQRSVARPYAFNDDHYVIGCSIGICVYPQHGKNADELLACADRAMYDAKAAGGGIRAAS